MPLRVVTCAEVVPAEARHAAEGSRYSMGHSAGESRDWSWGARSVIKPGDRVLLVHRGPLDEDNHWQADPPRSCRAVEAVPSHPDDRIYWWGSTDAAPEQWGRVQRAVRRATGYRLRRDVLIRRPDVIDVLDRLVFVSGEPRDVVIGSWEDCMAFYDVGDQDDLGELVDEAVDPNGWADRVPDPDLPGVVPIVETRGTLLEYPFTVGEFWDTVTELESEVSQTWSLEGLEEDIDLVEGITVVFDRQPRRLGVDIPYAASSPVGSYPYERAFRREGTVDQWLARRVYPLCRGFEVTVFGRDGEAEGSTKLRDL